MPHGSQQSLSPEVLAALGADALAALFISHAEEDPDIGKKLKMLLADTDGADNLAAEIAKRVRTIGRSRSIRPSPRD